MVGRVVSIKTNNTATVLISWMARHPLYKKTFKRSRKYLVDAGGGIKEGDMVEIIKVRPISKNKHWKITKVVGKNLEEITKEALKAEAEEIIAEVMPEEKVVDEESSVVSPQTEKEQEAKESKSKKRRGKSDS